MFEFRDSTTHKTLRRSSSHDDPFLSRLQSYYGEPSVQQKLLGLMVGSVCVCCYDCASFLPQYWIFTSV